MAFDPDAYLKSGSQTPGFDPDAYLGIEKKNQTLLDVAKLVPQMAGIAYTDNLKHTAVPAAIGLAGAMGGGPAAALAGGIAAIGKRMSGIASGQQPPSGTPLQEAIGPMAQAATAGIAQEPGVLNEIPGVPSIKEMASNLASKTGRGIAKGFQAFSGAKTGDYVEAAKKGWATYSAPSKPEAGQMMAKALEKLPGASIVPTLQETVQGAISPESSVANKFLNDLAGKMDEGYLPDARDALRAKQALDDVIDTVPKGQVKRLGTLYNLKSTFDDILSNQSGKLKEASNAYRAASLKANLTKFLPVNKSGEYSRLAPMLSTVAGTAKGLFTSPLTLGALATTGGTAVQGLNKLAQDPTIRQTLLQVLQRIKSSGAAPQ